MNKLYPTELFEQIARNVHNDIDQFREEKKASLIGIKMSDDGISYEPIFANGDIYTLLESHSAMKKAKDSQYDLVAVLTSGWAAPNNDDQHRNTPPSEHPERKRVKMTLVGNTSIQYGSVLSINGQGEDMFDYMTASGSLAESFTEFMEKWRGNE